MLEEKLLNSVIEVKTTKDVENLINTLEEKYELEWLPIGGRESNHSTFQMLANGENGIIERLTNAIDAVIEKEFYLNPDFSLKNPRMSAQKYFDIKNGDLSICSDTDIDKNNKDLVKLIVSESGKKKKPTIEIRDKGIGLNADEFATTILSLQGGNKLKKFYLAGTFGQGGSTANIFSPHTVYISKGIKEKNPNNMVSFTITKEFDDFNYKAPVHKYLVDKKTKMPITICDKNNEFESGTLVKHIEMTIGGYGNSDANAPGSNSILFFVNNILFNPILPIKITETRESVAKTNIERNNNSRPANGCHRRLNKSEKVLDSGTIVSNYGFGGSFSINYWILEKNEDYKNFNNRSTPILYTINGQVQGTQGNNILTKIGKPYLMEHLIVNVNCDNISDGYKTRLFTSDRVRFATNDYSEMLKAQVESILEKNDKLDEYNKIFHDRLLQDSMDNLSDELNRKIENKLKVFLQSDGIGNLTSNHRKKHINPPGPYISEANEEFPTFIKISNKNPYELEIGTSLALNYISDADYTKFDMQSNLNCSSSNDEKLFLDAYKFYKNGHGIIIFKLGTDTKIGDEFLLKIYIEGYENDDKLSSSIFIKIVDKKEEKSPDENNKDQNTVPKINTIPLGRTDPNYELLFGEDETTPVVLKDNIESIDIYINMEIIPIQKLIENINKKDSNMDNVKIIKDEYVKQISFHRLLLHYEQKEIEDDLQNDEEKINMECKRAAILITGMIDDNLTVYVNELGDTNES